jgi:hypothetical protein
MQQAVTSDTTLGVTDDQAEGSWRDALPEVLVDAPYFRDAKSPEDLRQKIDNASFWQGNSILKPGTNASEEQIAANKSKVLELYPDFMPIPDPYSEDVNKVWERLGKPDAADKYKLPEGVELDPEEAGLIKAIALDAGLTQAQFEKQQAALISKRKELIDQQKHKRDEGIAALRNELGATYDDSMKRIETMLNTDPLIPPQFKAAHEAGQLDAATYRWLDNLVKQGDEVTQMPDQRQTEVGITPAQAIEEAEQIRERLFKMQRTDKMYPILQQKLIEAEMYAAGRRPV